MPTVSFDMTQTFVVAVLLLLLGNWINSKVSFFTKYCIPGAVVGGLIFCIIALILRQTGLLAFKYNVTLQQFFMNLFFTASGFGASMALLKKGGKLVAIFLVLAAALAFLQNALSVGLGFVLTRIGIDIKPMIALMTGSIPLTGGHGNAASFAPLAEQLGYTGANAVAVAAATYGLVTGSLMGGPLANRLIIKKNLMAVTAADDAAIDETVLKARAGTMKELPKAFWLISVALGLGSVLFILFKKLMPGVTLPIHVMGMLAGVIFRIIMDTKKIEVPEDAIERLGNIFLGVFVSMAVYTMALWELITLALPIIIILLIQLILMWVFAYYITFPLMGSNYDAAVICAGHVGFGLGAVPVSMANMNSVCSKYRYSKVAYFVVPIIGGLFSNFTNAAIITMWMNWCK
jgi:ESS family glutamate:Na+ symporter